MARFVLVAGGWSGGWIWQRLTPLLRDAGHEVFTPTLTGLGERVHLGHADIDLETHITDIVNVLRFEDLQQVVLVGWSHGGMVITGVAERVPERLAQLIYLDAVVPMDGQSYYDADPNGETRLAEDRAEAKAAGTPAFRPVPVDYLLARVTDEADRAWLLANMVPHPLASLVEPLRLEQPVENAVPRAFILCTEGKDPGFQTLQTAADLRADPAWHYREVASNHLAPVVAPRLVAEALLALIELTAG